MLFWKKYSKRKDAKTWNRKAVLGQIVREANDPRLSVIGNDKIVLTDHISLLIDSSNIDWVDLFSLTKQFLKKWHRPLSIYKDEEWEGSYFQADTQNIHIPLLDILANPTEREKFLRGEQAIGAGKSLKLPATTEQWIIDKTKELATVLESRN